MLPAALWTAVCAAIVAAPWLAARGAADASSALYSLFAGVCHQDPARSFDFAGHPWAVCHRCSGIYFGLFLLSFFPYELAFITGFPARRRLWILAGCLPMALDVLSQWTGLRANTPATRFASGLIFGLMLASLTVPAMAEFLRDTRRRRGQAALGGLS